MADTQITGTLSTNEPISGSLSANEGMSASLTPDEEVSGRLQVKRSLTVPTYLNDITDVNVDNPQDGQVLKYHALTDEWENSADIDNGIWGQITGTLSDQTDLQNALDAKIPSTEKGSNNGVATLDATGRVPSSQLPSYVDDVLEYASLSAFPATGETGKIYVALDTNKMYRWGGSTYVEVSESLALGETTGTAYEGSKGKANADNISAIQGKIPSNASSSNKMATASDITDINNKIPSNASSSNKLATASDIPVITGKADKVQNATSGHFAGLDANGNLTDSGITAADMVGVSEELLKDTVGWTGKNLIPYPYYSSDNSIIKANSDGSITVNGTPSSDLWYRFNDITLPAGSYIFSCSGTSISSAPLTFGVRRISDDASLGMFYLPNATSVSFTLTETTNVRLRLFGSRGIAFPNTTIYPMLRLASINDATYEPYHKPVSEWAYTRSEASILGAKNLNAYPYYHTTSVLNGVTFTDNGDGTVLANNMATPNNAAFNCHSRALNSVNYLIVPNGRYILSGCPSGGSLTTYHIAATITKNGSAYNLGADTGNGVIITLNGDDNYNDKVQLQIQCVVMKNYTADNLLFKPMLRLASDPDNTFVPFAMTNKELTDKVVKADTTPTSGSKNLVTSGGVYSYIDTMITQALSASY